MLMLLLWWR